MKRSLKVIVAVLLLALPVGLSAQCYELVWSEEFDYTGFPDSKIWTFESGGGGWGNNELQYYKANDQDNSYVENGQLTIRAIKESFGGRSYTSARIITRGKFNFKYGKIEARMKLPYGQGIWPAFWIMGESIGTVGWPACGEIDIMELVGGPTRDNTVHGTAHWDNNGSHAQYGKPYSLSTGKFADDYHTFTVEWNSSYIRWYVDGKQYNVLDIRSSGLSEFHNDFFILLNIAVGGNWPGSPDATTVFPQTLEVDYVRIYKTQTDVSAFPIDGPETLPALASSAEFSLPFSPGWTYEWTVPADAVIVSGQGTENIAVDWGCSAGEISCAVTGTCGNYLFKKKVELKPEIHGPMFIAPGQQNVLLYTDSLKSTSFTWSVPSDAIIVSGQGTDSVRINWGQVFDTVRLEMVNSCGTLTTDFIPVKKGQYPYPDISKPHAIPGSIEAIHYDYGGEGLAFHDTSPANEGDGARKDEAVDTQNSDGGNPNIGWVTNGEWLEYSIKVETDTFYSINMRMATANATGGPFSVLFNDEVRLSGIKLSNTGGWTTFVSRKIGTVRLSPADTLMRLYFNTGGLNIGKMTFTPTTDPTGLDETITAPVLNVYPNPSAGWIYLESDLPILSVRLSDVNGRMLREVQGKGPADLKLNISEEKPGVYFLGIVTGDGHTHHRKVLKTL